MLYIIGIVIGIIMKNSKIIKPIEKSKTIDTFYGPLYKKIEVEEKYQRKKPITKMDIAKNKGA